MIDPRVLRDDPDRVRAAQAKRGLSDDVVDRALAADSARRGAIADFEAKRAEQKQLGKNLKTVYVDTGENGMFSAEEFVAITSPDNEGSRRVLEAIGLRFEGLIRLGDDPREVRLFGVNFAEAGDQG